MAESWSSLLRFTLIRLSFWCWVAVEAEAPPSDGAEAADGAETLPAGAEAAAGFAAGAAGAAAGT